jgi:hypothetical protein
MLEQILLGGWMMIPLMALSFVAWRSSMNGGWPFERIARLIRQPCGRKIIACLRAGDPDGAIAICAATGGPVASVLLVGLRSYVQLRDKKENSETMRMVVGQVMEDYSAQAMGV